MTSIVPIAAALALLGSPALPQPWNLAPCGREHEAEHERFREELLRAQPGSPGYVPHPYPQTSQQVVEDFLHFHRQAWSDTPFTALPPAEQRFFTALKEDLTDVQMVKVANWTPTRCGRNEEKDFYFLLRFFDKRSGQEMTRVAVDEAGHVAQLAHRPEARALLNLPALGPSVATVAKAHGWRPSARQYVALWGSLRCDELSPCISFRVGAEAYLLQSERLYRIARERPRFSIRQEMSTVEDKRRFLTSFERKPEKAVTLGGDVMMLAVPVQP
jgi:hypothetical protein